MNDRVNIGHSSQSFRDSDKNLLTTADASAMPSLNYFAKSQPNPS
jgi:hypothetical protein